MSLAGVCQGAVCLCCSYTVHLCLLMLCLQRVLVCNITVCNKQSPTAVTWHAEKHLKRTVLCIVQQNQQEIYSNDVALCVCCVCAECLSLLMFCQLAYVRKIDKTLSLVAPVSLQNRLKSNFSFPLPVTLTWWFLGSGRRCHSGHWSRL